MGKGTRCGGMGVRSLLLCLLAAVVAAFAVAAAEHEHVVTSLSITDVADDVAVRQEDDREQALGEIEDMISSHEDKDPHIPILVRRKIHQLIDQTHELKE